MRRLPTPLLAFALSAPLFALPAAPAHALASAKSGVVYTAGQRVRIDALEVSLKIPPRWKGGLSPDGEWFVLGSDTEPGLITGTGRAQTGPQALARELAQNIPLDAATILLPKGAPKVEGSRIRAEYAVSHNPGQMIALARGRVLKNGAGVAFIAVGPQSARSTYEKKLARLLRDLRVARAPQGSAAGGGAWATTLKGRALTYYKTGNGYSDKRHLSLCANGQYRYRQNDSYLSGGFTAAGENGGAGRWQIKGDRLILHSQDGSQTVHRLSRQGTKTLVDGARWFVTSDPQCGY